ncbi:MAG: carboxymuconolactone decarboxylase family protein [Pseudomonadota bacterium]
MPFIEPLPRESLPDLEPTFQDTESFLGFLPNDVLTMAYMAEPTKAFMDFCLAIYKNATLPQILLHLVGMVASAASGCRYCTSHLANKLFDEGADKQKITDVWLYETSPLFTPAERAALALAQACGQSPSQVDQAHYDALRKHYTEREIVELMFIICQFGFWNRWNDGVGTVLEDAPRTFSEQTLPEEHWSLGKHAAQ